MMRIRPELATDREVSLEVEREAFGEPEEAAIVEVVRDLDGSFALVADDDGAIVGHVQMSRAWIGVEPVLSLGPIGVLPARQGEGIGSSLVRAALQAARERGETAVILLGSQAFYPRFGFRAGSTFGLREPVRGHAGGRVRRAGRRLHDRAVGRGGRLVQRDGPLASRVR